MDWENLLEEIEDMARFDLKACISYLAVILEHLYKWDNFRPLTKAGRDKGVLSWIASIENARRKLNVLLKRYLSLKEKLPKEPQLAWEEATAEIVAWLIKDGKDPEKYNIQEEYPYTYETAITRDLRKELKP